MARSIEDAVVALMIEEELDAVLARWGSAYHSAHEAYAVLAEEVDEFWEEVRKKRSARDPRAMVCELVQIAVVARKYAAQLVGGMAMTPELEALVDRVKAAVR